MESKSCCINYCPFSYGYTRADWHTWGIYPSQMSHATTCVLASDACECLLKSAGLEFGQLKTILVKRLYYKSPDLYLVAVCS